MLELLVSNCRHYVAPSKAPAWLTHCQSYRRVYGVHCITVVSQYNLICCVRDVWNTVICFVRVYAVKCNADVFHFGNLVEFEWKSHEILNTVSQCGVSSLEIKQVWEFEEVILRPPCPWVRFSTEHSVRTVDLTIVTIRPLQNTSFSTINSHSRYTMITKPNCNLILPLSM
jgi:hypothetical protein